VGTDTQGKRIQTFNPGKRLSVFRFLPLDGFPGDQEFRKTADPNDVLTKFGPRLGLAYSRAFFGRVTGQIFGRPGNPALRASYGLYTTSVSRPENPVYEVADATVRALLLGTSPSRSLFERPFPAIPSTGQSLNPAFSVHRAGSGRFPSNLDTDFSVNGALQTFPGLRHSQNQGRLTGALPTSPIQARAKQSQPVLTVAYVGTRGHRPHQPQREAKPRRTPFCAQQPNAPGEGL